MLLQHKRNLIRRGYSNTVISRQLKSIKFSMRKASLIQKSKKNCINNNSNSITAPTLKLSKPTYTARYCPNAGKAYRIVHKHWKTTITNSSVLKRLIANRPRLAYKANNNLSKKLVRAKLKNKSPIEQSTSEPNHTCHQTSQPHTLGPQICRTGIHNPMHRRVLSPAWQTPPLLTDQEEDYKKNIQHTWQIQLWHSIHRVPNTMQKCNRQYVGQTSQSLKMRFSRQLIQFGNHQIPGTLLKHFRPGKSCHGIHNIGVQPLHIVRPRQRDSGKQIEQKLKNLEKTWMNRLKCVFPQGLNWLEDDPRIRYRK